VAAIARLTDEEALRAFCGDPNWVLRRAAVARTANRALIIAAALDDPDPYVREEAVQRVADPTCWRRSRCATRRAPCASARCAR